MRHASKIAGNSRKTVKDIAKHYALKMYIKRYKFDDERVTKEDNKRALEEQYGGEEELLQTNPGFNNSPFKFTKYSNDYMLVYLRESDKDKIICNVNKEDIVEHSRERLKNEQEEKDHKKKEEAQEISNLRDAKVIKEREAAQKAIQEAPLVIKETPVIIEDTKKINSLMAEVNSLKKPPDRSGVLARLKLYNLNTYVEKNELRPMFNLPYRPPAKPPHHSCHIELKESHVDWVQFRYASNVNSTSLCRSSLKVADFSYNFLVGSIPRCLEYLPRTIFQGNCLRVKVVKQRTKVHCVGASPYQGHLVVKPKHLSKAGHESKHEGGTVLSTVDMKSLFLLTGPNGGGKSSLLRSICASALLGICGHMVPAESAMIPYFDSITLHMKSHDNPADHKSSFQKSLLNHTSIGTRNMAGQKSLLNDFSNTTKDADIVSEFVNREIKDSSLAGSLVHLHGNLKLKNKQGLPYFEFKVNSTEYVFVAKIWRVGNALNWVYTFHSFDTRTKNNAGLGSQQCDKDSSSRVAQMLVSCSLCSKLEDGVIPKKRSYNKQHASKTLNAPTLESVAIVL